MYIQKKKQVQHRFSRKPAGMVYISRSNKEKTYVAMLHFQSNVDEQRKNHRSAPHTCI